MNESPAPLWDDRAVERRWGKGHGFMSDLRARGQGPAFLRLSARTIRYRPEAVIAYENQQEGADATSDFKAPPDSIERVEPPARKRIAFTKSVRKHTSGRDKRPETIEMFPNRGGSHPERESSQESE